VVLTGIPTEPDEYLLSLEDELKRAYTQNKVPGEVFSAKDLDVFGKCLRRMLTLDPARRPTARELVTEEEWFGLDHILQVTGGCEGSGRAV